MRRFWTLCRRRVLPRVESVRHSRRGTSNGKLSDQGSTAVRTASLSGNGAESPVAERTPQARDLRTAPDELAVGAPALADPVPDVLIHLHRLTSSLVRDGAHCAYVHVYARPLGAGHEPLLQFIPAQESGVEGIACVDDASRAALLALQVYEQTGSQAAAYLARAWLSFVVYMQEPDGRFVNFILDETGLKNRCGPTSYAGGPWWTARAMRALATAWRLTGDERYRRAVLRGRLRPTHNLKVTALQVLALLQCYAAQPGATLQKRICARCDTIIASGPDYFRDRGAEAAVRMWGYHQLQAVAQAARLFDRRDYVAACAATVNQLVAPVIAAGFFHVYPLQQDGQCAYDISPLLLGLEELYNLTGTSRDRDLALECAAWLRGNNPVRAVMYDAQTGRCWDGLTRGIVSGHCGAESAIEAGLMEMARRRLVGRQHGLTTLPQL